MQIRRVSIRCFFYLRQLRTLRRVLTVETITILVDTFIISRVHYCNSVLYGANSVHLHSLQLVLNDAARIIVQKRKFDPITTSIRDELHCSRSIRELNINCQFSSSSVYVELLRHIWPSSVYWFQPTSTENDSGHLHEITSCVRESISLGTALVVSTHLDPKHGTSSRTMPVTLR